MKKPGLKRPNRNSYYLISQQDIDKIDSLIGALDLAISEILHQRPIQENLSDSPWAQTDYDDQINEILYRDDPY